jgi:hypothetical protein
MAVESDFHRCTCCNSAIADRAEVITYSYFERLFDNSENEKNKQHFYSDLRLNSRRSNTTCCVLQDPLHDAVVTKTTASRTTLKYTS